VTDGTITLRRPTVADGTPVWRLVEACGALERNTAYAYLLLCSHFAGTSVVAERDDGALVGFVAAYRPPTDPDALFVWQVGVHPDGRGQGLAKRMLAHLIERTWPEGVRYLSATVTPDNGPSNALFTGFARRYHAECALLPGFESEHFPDGHDPERLYRIGPLVPSPPETPTEVS